MVLLIIYLASIGHPIQSNLFLFIFEVILLQEALTIAVVFILFTKIKN